MTDITHEEIRDLLPELLHSPDEVRRAEIERHLHACAECAAELRVLRMVKDAPSFAPMIDAVKVSSLIPPYAGVPAKHARRAPAMWPTLSAAAAAVLLVGGFLLSPKLRPAGNREAQMVATTAPVSPTTEVAAPPINSKPTVAKPEARETRPRELQVAVGLEDLSDGSIAQLASDVDALDGLPSPDPENLGVVDAGAESGGVQ